MKRIVITYGTVAGIVLIIMLALNLIYSPQNTDGASLKFGEVFGYVTMIVALSLIFLGSRLIGINF